MPGLRPPLGKCSPYQMSMARASSVRLMVSKTKTPPGASTRATSAIVALRLPTCSSTSRETMTEKLPSAKGRDSATACS